MFGILLGLVVLMALAYLGWSIIWVAPIAAGVVALTGGLDLLDAYTDTYMSGFVDFARNWFPVFMLGAIFGKLANGRYRNGKICCCCSHKINRYKEGNSWGYSFVCSINLWGSKFI